MTASGPCRVCNGTGRVGFDEKVRPSILRNPDWYYYDEKTDTIPCRNCTGTGNVRLNREGVPCTHEFDARYPYGRHRGYVEYKCKHCGEEYSVDSTD